MNRSRAVVAAVLAVALVVALGCADDAANDAGRPDGRAGAGPGIDGQASDGRTGDRLVVTTLVDGFAGPTQMTFAPDGRLLVAELNGGERAGAGRVVAVDLDAPDDRFVLVDDLLTPTGVVAEGGRLWIMERRRLTVGPLADPSDRRVVLDEMPFNGRSQGTITSVPGGGILYDTSGRRDGDRLVAGSGTLWQLRGPDAEPEAYATGFKHAYAHTFASGGGRLFVTEMSDGRLDGAVPPDELVVVEPGDDFGYPRCVGDRAPIAELGADAATCAATPRSHALFEPGATPTSVVVAPWDPSVLLVALWNRGEIVAVPAADEGRPHPGDVVVAEIARPQHLLVDGARVLVSDHATGRILAIAPP